VIPTTAGKFSIRFLKSIAPIHAGKWIMETQIMGTWIMGTQIMGTPVPLNP